MMSGRLIALDMHTGVIPVGVEETWRQLMSKCLLWMTGQEAKAACWTEQLASGMEAGIVFGIQDMRVLWQ